jgi:hypothetical protein
LREALQVIGRWRNSLSIKSFLSEQSTIASPSQLMSDESHVAVGPFERMSLNEAFIILGITGEPDRVTDEAIIYSYDNLVLPFLTLLTTGGRANR